MVLKLGMIAFVWFLSGAASAARIITLSRTAYTLTYDCDLRSALRYEYSLDKDKGSAPRPRGFSLDPDLPPGCKRQFRAQAYEAVAAGWDRGHLVTSNHMDMNAKTMKEANYMSNVAPQASRFNKGIWVEAENVAECYRDVAPLRVVGGLVYEDESNDYFLESHGIPTPEYFWKVILTTDPRSGEEKAIAWLIPNRDDVGELDEYIVSIQELEEAVGADAVNIQAADEVKAMKPTRTWKLPGGCRAS